MKRIHGMTVVVATIGAMAFAQASETQADETNLPRFRAQASGFGRHGIKAAGERESLYGADIDVYFNVWRIRQFNWWIGIGCGWAPERELFSDSSSTTYGSIPLFGIDSIDVNHTRDLKMGYGELRLMTVPEWNLTDWFSVGLRLGVAFDFVSVSGRNREDRTTHYMPYLLLTDTHDVIRNDSYDTDKMVAAGIVGLQATVMPWDNFGLYGSVDARLGGDVDVGAGEKVEMNSLQWNAGFVFQF